MDFRRGHLQYFVAVAEEGSITRAAARLHVSQPALSQAISLLESDLGLKLLERHARGVRLTAHGAAFLPKARSAVSAWTHAFALGHALREGRENTIVFGFLGIPPGLDSPAPLQRFLHAHPDLDLRYRELPFPTSPTSAWLGDADVAVCHQPAEDEQLWMQLLRVEPRVVLAPQRHPLAQRQEVTVEELLEERFIGLHPAVDPSWAGFWSLDDHRGGPPREVTADTAANPQEAIAALSMREAITTVPAPVARLIASSFPDLAAVPVRGVDPARIVLVGRTDPRNPHVARLLAFARSGAIAAQP